MNFIAVYIFSTLAHTARGAFPVPDMANEARREYWSRLGKSEIKKKLDLQRNTNRAKNVILFLGDGMGVSTVTAARIFKGQSQNNFSGEESVMFWEQFPHVSLSKTYGLDAQTSDSANSATAYLCGVKANIGTVGVDSTVKAKQCHNDTAAYVESIMKWAQDAGMWTGIVTTARVTDASPAAAYAHSGYRRWQQYVPENCTAQDIAQQLIYGLPGSQIRVIMGGGRKVFLSNKSCDEEGKPGARSDNENLILKWQELKENASAVYVWNRTGLLEVNTSSTEYLLGGRIDHAHHANRAKLAMQETMEFEEAVNRTTSALPDNETLIVVTADHSHTMTIAGHPPRGTNIFGFAGNTTSKTPVQYTVISYGVGPQGARTLTNMTEEETASIDFVQQAAFPLWSAPHGGEDVAVYARGPWAHLFDGVNDQTYIPYVMAYAACIGQFNGSECHECLK
ncbi:alkaline phosphatase, tissue-nonspecific isozyme-like isoform X2 [Amblyomma americanum]